MWWLPPAWWKVWEWPGRAMKWRQQWHEMKEAKAKRRTAERAVEAPSQETVPEIVLRCEKMFYETEESLIVQHIGGGSVRNVQVVRMTNGNWAADFDSIPYIAVKGRAVLKPRFTPVSPRAIREYPEHTTGRVHMTLGFFLMTSVDMGVGPIPITIRYEDASSKLEVETDFNATYGDPSRDQFNIVEQYVFTQTVRRVKQQPSS